MSALDHQVKELRDALQQTINIEATKARLDVQTIIRDGLDTGATPIAILSNIIEWTGSDIKRWKL